MKRLLALIVLIAFLPIPSFAGTLAETFDGIVIMGAAPDPLLTTLIEDDSSHTMSLLDTQSKKYTWIGLTYNGTGTCVVRMMKTNAPTSYPAYKVAPGGVFDRVIHKNAKFFNYSGCAGTTASNTGTGNSIIELQ